ncbi:MAG: cellulase family glycosylhydrolase [Phycisphaeraceae bacterium]
MICLKLGFVAVAVFALLAMDGSLLAASLPEMTVPLSMGVQAKPDTSSTQSLQAMNDLHFRHFRRGFYWNGIEPAKGQYVFTQYDRIIADAEKMNLGIVACLFGGNAAYENDGLGGIQTEEGRRGFANFAAALAERYKGKRIYWEIWNEPNVRTFWRKNGKHNSDEFAQEYTDLVKAVAPAMLKADPDCFVVAGSVSNYWEPSYQWTESCFKKGILKSGIRGWSVHPYGVKTPEEHVIGHGRTRDLLKQYGAAADFPILNTERGFAVKKPTDNDEGWSGGSEEKALEYQSWHFVRQYMIDLMAGVRLTMWYEWQAEKFGILEGDKERPVAGAVRTLVEQLDGYQFDRRIDLKSPQDYALRFVNGKTGGEKLVVWTAPPAKEAPDQAQPHEVSIPVQATGSLPTVQIYGEKGTVEVKGGTISLTISGAPQYITVRAAK